MFRTYLIPAMSLAIVSLSLPAQASDTCSRATPGKCKVWQTAPPKKASPGAVTHQAVQPQVHGNHKGREAYTPAQRDKIMESARALCRKVYGAPSTVYSYNYKRNEVTCMAPSY